MLRFLILLFVLLVGCLESPAPLTITKSAPFNVIWDTPSQDKEGSMPLGNGDVGGNVWITPEGELNQYLAKTDAFNQNAQLLKLGAVAVSLSPNPFREEGFMQALLLEDGSVQVTQTDNSGDTVAEILVWIDAHNPVVQIDVETAKETRLQVDLKIWRDSLRQLASWERHAAYGMVNSGGPIYVNPDTVFSLESPQLVWAHRNDSSIWSATLENQGLAALTTRYQDPLLYRTFGGLVQGTGLAKSSDRQLTSEEPAKSHSVQIQVHSSQEEEVNDWITSLQNEAEIVAGKSIIDRYYNHRLWWRNFWNRSYLIPSGSAAADSVAQAYILQRYLSACAGRGVLPIKFNGSLFNVGGTDEQLDVTYNADYRRWGGPYWFQNTRLVYWPMLESGDFEMMAPLFRMYLNNLPFAKDRTSTYFDHGGAFFPETQYFWGAYTQDNYGWQDQREEAGLSDKTGTTLNQYIRYHYDGALELTALMLDYYFYTGQDGFLYDTLLPLSNEIIGFYQQHYPRDEQGELLVYPAQALETYWDVENPTPVIAGLRWTLGELLRIPHHKLDSLDIESWQAFLDDLPKIPVGEKNGQRLILPAEDTLQSSRTNIENPELYAIFPFRIYGIGGEDLTLAVRTFKSRQIRGNRGWYQDETQAAYLGLAEEAKNGLVKRVLLKHQDSRFTVFWGPNFDWIPDQDHGGNLLKALQVMMIQTVGDSILLMPAWPKTWNAEFRLHSTNQTVVEGSLINGAVDFQVQPPEREKQVKLMLDE